MNDSPQPTAGVSPAASTPAPAASPPALRLTPFRYVVTGLLIAFALMSLSLHLPVDSLIPESAISFLVPSFVFFMPLTRFWMWLLPVAWRPDTLAGCLSMCGLDLALAAVFCLPFLFPNDRRQQLAAGFSLLLLSGYVILSAWHYIHLRGMPSFDT